MLEWLIGLEWLVGSEALAWLLGAPVPPQLLAPLLDVEWALQRSLALAALMINLLALLQRFNWPRTASSSAEAGVLLRAPPWRNCELDEVQRFEAAVRSAPRLLGFLTGNEPQQLYGLYKQATMGDARDGTESGGLKARVKLAAWRSQTGRPADECRAAYVQLVDTVTTRAAASVLSNAALPSPQARFADLRCRVRIIGTGHYLPERVVTNEWLERRGGFDAGSLERARSGVRLRHFAAANERASAMAARAARQALEAANVRAEQLSCIINASGTPEQCIPDGACLLQRELGLGTSGIRAFSVHATCLSFLVGLEAACMLLDRADAAEGALVLVCSSEITSRHVDPSDEHVAPLFGDGAAACVLRKAARGQHSAVHACHMETYADGAELTEVRGAGTNFPFHDPDDRSAVNPAATREINHFQMDGPGTIRMVRRPRRSRGPAPPAHSNRAPPAHSNRAPLAQQYGAVQACCLAWRSSGAPSPLSPHPSCLSFAGAPAWLGFHGEASPRPLVVPRRHSLGGAAPGATLVQSRARLPLVASSALHVVGMGAHGHVHGHVCACADVLGWGQGGSSPPFDMALPLAPLPSPLQQIHVPCVAAGERPRFGCHHRRARLACGAHVAHTGPDGECGRGVDPAHVARGHRVRCHTTR